MDNPTVEDCLDIINEPPKKKSKFHANCIAEYRKLYANELDAVESEDE